MTSQLLDFRQKPSLKPADLLELFRENVPQHPLFLKALATKTDIPGPEIPAPPALTERREAILAALYRGEQHDAETMASAWLEAACGGESGLELSAAAEAFSFWLETQGALSDSATALALALRLHDRRPNFPFHGILLRRAARTLGALGGIDVARLVAAEALRLAIETEDNKAIALSLGAAFRTAALAEDWPAALSAITAAHRYVTEGQHELKFSLHQGATSVLLHLGRVEEAETEVAAATRCLANHTTPLMESYLAWTWGSLRQAQGRHEEATVHLTQAAELGRGTLAPQVRICILPDLAESFEKLGRQAQWQQQRAELLKSLPPIESLEGRFDSGEILLARAS